MIATKRPQGLVTDPQRHDDPVRSRDHAYAVFSDHVGLFSKPGMGSVRCMQDQMIQSGIMQCSDDRVGLLSKPGTGSVRCMQHQNKHGHQEDKHRHVSLLHCYNVTGNSLCTTAVWAFITNYFSSGSKGWVQLHHQELWWPPTGRSVSKCCGIFTSFIAAC